MGSQSNLLILLVVIICGIAVYVGITMFAGKNIESIRDQVRTELGYLSQEAIAHYNRPVNLGGGGRTFLKFNGTKRMKISTKRKRAVSGTRLWESETAVYTVLAAAADSVVIEGKTDEIGNDGTNPIRIWGVVKPNGFYSLSKN